MWKTITLKDIFRVIINKVFTIPNIKFLDLVLSYQVPQKEFFIKLFSWLTPPVNLVATLESINSPLNSELLYYKLVNIVKL